jgi:hypothetical protein
VGLTYDQAKALGLAHLWPKPSERPASPTIPTPTKAPDDGMNKLEREFWNRATNGKAEWRIQEVWREPFALRLAGRTSYRPDFLIQSGWVDRLQIWETKGFMRDDAAVKIKVAAEMYGCFEFVLATKQGRRWDCRSVTRTGISREVWRPTWLE